MKTDSIVDAEDHITEDAIERSATSLVPGEAVLMVTRSGILAHSFPVAVAKTSVALNQDLKALIPHEGIDGEFVAWALRRYGPDILAKCSKHGTTVHSIETPRLKAFEIPVAPTAEQRRIVEKIDELFSQIEAGEQALARAQKLLERYRQSVLNAAVTGELSRDWREQHKNETESGWELLKRILRARREAWEQAELAKIGARGKPPTGDRWKQKYKEPKPADTADLADLPEGWVWATVEQLSLLVTDGDHNPPARVKDGIPHLTAKNVSGGRLNPAGSTFVSKEGFERTRSRYEPKEGDLIVTCVGTIARTAIVPADFVFSADRNLAAVRVVPGDMLVEYLKMVIDAPSQQMKMMNLSGSTAQPHLYLRDLRAFPIPLPSAEEQRWLAENLEECLLYIGVNELEISDELRRSAALRQSVLTSAFSGKLVPQDSADEPAWVLLERIREERTASAQAAGRTRRGRRGQPSKKAQLAMVKKRKEIEHGNLRDIVRASNGGIAAEALWKASELDIDDFYKQLREEVAAGHLREERDGDMSRIVCV